MNFPFVKRSCGRLAIIVALALGLAPSRAAVVQSPTINQPWTYQLVNDGSLTDDCPICGRPTILEEMRGSFELRLLDRNPLFTRYAIENIAFTAGSTRSYKVTGSGTLKIGGEVAVTQEMFLQVNIDDGITNKLCYFTSTPEPASRPWPMLDIYLDQTNGTFIQHYSLRLAAAPLREIWFSTANPFTSASGPAAFVEGGDLISTSGLRVKRNADLFTSVGAFPPVPDLGLDAIDILPGGEIAFSLQVNITSTTLGQLQHGDLLSNRGRILRRNQDLLGPFGIMPPAPDVGLDAVHVLDGGEILFSISSNIFSERLGVFLRPGDLLSSSGQVLRSNQQLLSKFHPPKPLPNDYGLDAIYVWPGGETWFSVGKGFQDEGLGPILDGDLLSDQGYIVFRNLELLNAFSPIEDASNFGLDALYIVTDAIPPAALPRLSITRGISNASLTWTGEGRVFQVERAATVVGPFLPLSPIIPDRFYMDAGVGTNGQQGYYRVRQW